MAVLRFYICIRNCKKLLDNTLQYSVTSPFLHDAFLLGPQINNTARLSRHFSKNDLESNKSEKKKSQKVFIRADGKEEKRKMPSGPKISLLKDNSKVTMYLSEAEKMAKHNGFKLVQIGFDHDKMMYKFSKVSSVFGEETPVKKKTPGKHVKKLILKSEINDYDLQYKIKNVNSQLEKGLEIRVVLENKFSGNSEKLEELLEKVRKLLTCQYEVKNKQLSKGSLKFFLIPVREQNESDSKENQELGKRNNEDKVL